MAEVGNNHKFVSKMNKDELQKKVKDLQGETGILNNQLENWKKKCEEYENKAEKNYDSFKDVIVVSDLKHTIQELEDKYDELNTRHDELKINHISKINKIKELEQGTGNNPELQQKYNQLNCEWNNTISKYEDEIKQLKNQLIDYQLKYEPDKIKNYLLENMMY